VGKALRIGDYEAKLVGFDQGSEPHRKWIAATLELSGAGMAPQLLRPRMNFFERSTDPIGTPAVRSTALGDVYFSLLALSEDNRTATLNAWIFPMVGWIWWSIPILVLGSLIAIWPGKRSKLVASVPSGVEGPLVPSGVEGAEASDLNRGAA
jgi:cytochrome c-type biogenesis protein CcmF